MELAENIKLSKVTIVIPTFNRPKDLLRLITFLQKLNNLYPVFVLDSSTKEIQIINKKTCDVGNIKYISFPEYYLFSSKVRDFLNKTVISEYMIFCGDDDFVIPAGINQAALFLDAHPDFSAVTGVTKCLAYPCKFNQLGLFAFLDKLKHPLVLDADTFLARYLKLPIFQEYTPPIFYALRRTKHVREIFNKIPEGFTYTSIERLSDSLTLLWGKSLTLPFLLLIRNYSTMPVFDSFRKRNIYSNIASEAVEVRIILAKEIKKNSNELTDEIVNFILDQFIKIPLENVMERYRFPELQSTFSKKIGYKKNWIFYLINYLFPYLTEIFDDSIKKEVVIALKKAFKSKLRL